MNPRNQRQTYSYSAMFKSIALLLMALPTLGVPISRRSDDFMLFDRAHPSMPDLNVQNINTTPYPPYLSGTFFTGVNMMDGAVFSGDHIIASDSLSDAKSMAWCFSYEALGIVLHKAIPDPSTLKPLTFNGANCSYSYTRLRRDADVSFDTVVFGLPPDDCERYQRMYHDHATYCIEHFNDSDENELDPSVKFWLGMLFGSWFVGCVCMNIFPHLERDSSNKEKLISQTKGITTSLKAYLKAIEESDFDLDEVDEGKINAIEADHPEWKCPILYALPKYPVRLDGRLYDVRSLLDRPLNNGQRLDPVTNLSFNVNEIQAARDIRNAILEEVNKKAGARLSVV